MESLTFSWYLQKRQWGIYVENWRCAEELRGMSSLHFEYITDLKIVSQLLKSSPPGNWCGDRLIRCGTLGTTGYLGRAGGRCQGHQDGGDRPRENSLRNWSNQGALGAQIPTVSREHWMLTCTCFTE